MMVDSGTLKHTRTSPSRVFVTGRGLLAGGHETIPGIWKSVLREESLAGSLPGDPELAELAGLSKPDALILARHQLLALSSVEAAWRSAGLPEQRNRIRGEGGKHRNPRFGCVSGTSLGGIAAMESETSALDFRPSPYSLSRWRGNSVGAVATLRYGLGATDLSINAASATGAQAVFMAGTMIRAGLADLVVAVAADSSLPERLLETMRRNGSTAKGPGSIPLSASRTGMSPAEGAACLILESANHAESRGAVPVAEWIGGSCLNESLHLMAPDDSSMVLEEAFRNLENDCLVSGDGHLNIDWVSLHATGTPRFDRAEIVCLKRLFPKSLPWISAFKRITGHALGASGLLEAALLAEGLKTRSLPPWPSGIDPTLRIDDRMLSAQPVPERALQIAQGMGGVVVLNLFASV